MHHANGRQEVGETASPWEHGRHDEHGMDLLAAALRWEADVVQSRYRIGLDLDGVIYRWEEQARKLIAREFGLTMPVSTEWDSIPKTLGRDPWKWLWKTGVHEVFSGGRPYPGAIEGAKRLSELGHVTILTKGPKGCGTDKIEWLDRKGVPYDEFVLVDSSSNKSAALPSEDVYIDDSSKNIVDLLSTHADLVLVDRPWNRGDKAPDVPHYRARGWREIVEIVETLVGER